MQIYIKLLTYTQCYKNKEFYRFNWQVRQNAVARHRILSIKFRGFPIFPIFVYLSIYSTAPNPRQKCKKLNIVVSSKK